MRKRAAKHDLATAATVRRSQGKRLRNKLASAAAGAIFEVIGEIPGVKTAIKVQQTAKSIRDELFENKVAAFLDPLARADEAASRAFVKDLAADAGSRKKAGAALVLILDRLDDMEKPAIIGRLYLAAIERRISFDELRRFCMIVDRAHLPDLVALSTSDEKEGIDGSAGQFLHALGLAEITGTDFGSVDGIGADTWYVLSKLGRKFLAAAFP